MTDEVRQLALQIARENPAWGYDRIKGAMANLGHAISDRSVGNIPLPEDGLRRVELPAFQTRDDVA